MFEFGGGLQELLLIFVVALLVVGPKRLPEVGRMLARAMRELRRASDEFRSTVETNLNLDAPSSWPASPEPAPSEPTSPTVPEVTPSELVTPEAEPDSGGGLCVEPYLAQRGSRLFHTRKCGWATRIKPADRLAFERAGDAEALGLRRCPACEAPG
jgi:Tat protein translocase TatB subunit